MSGPQENLKLEFVPDANQHILTVLEKVCFKCHEKKPISEFYKHSKMADGHLGKCKQCTKADTINNYAVNNEYYKNYDKLRAMLPHRVDMRKKYSETQQGKEAHKRSRKRWVTANPEKRQAHIVLGNSVRDGKIQKNPCQKCGDAVAEAHHPDYTKPLDVVWLCRSCHLAEHGKQSYQF